MRSDTEKKLHEIRIALKVADWLSVEEHIDYDVDHSLGILFIDGCIRFIDTTRLEFTESINPERCRYRFQYMDVDGNIIFRYDNAPHHRDIATFPDHKHVGDAVCESPSISLRQVIEEIVEKIVSAYDQEE